MRYLALAVDYDGTAASDGKLSDEASSALERLRTSGRRVVLVTGRRVDDLLRLARESHCSTWSSRRTAASSMTHRVARRSCSGLLCPRGLQNDCVRAVLRR
jgi:ribonucleotide monophosphatase NagD (HAD superfamily)